LAHPVDYHEKRSHELITINRRRILRKMHASVRIVIQIASKMWLQIVYSNATLRD